MLQQIVAAGQRNLVQYFHIEKEGGRWERKTCKENAAEGDTAGVFALLRFILLILFVNMSTYAKFPD